MTKNNFTYAVSFLFLIIGIVHALRLFNAWEAQIGDFTVPIWASWVAVLVAFYLSFQDFKLAKKA